MKRHMHKHTMVIYIKCKLHEIPFIADQKWLRMEKIIDILAIQGQ